MKRFRGGCFALTMALGMAAGPTVCFGDSYTEAQAARRDHLPVEIHREKPAYPFEMKRQGIEGEVLIQFIVDRRGNTRDLVVLRSTKPDFEPLALKAVLAFKYKPGLKNGVPVACRMQIPILYALSDKPKKSVFALKDHAPEMLDSPEPEASVDPLALSPAPAGVSYSKPAVSPREDAKPATPILPLYPADLLRAKIGGHAVARAALDAAGRVTEVAIDEASAPEFGHALRAALEAARFIPADEGGRPAETIITWRHAFDPALFTTLGQGGELAWVAAETEPGRIAPSKELDGVPRLTLRPPAAFPLALVGKTETAEALIEFLVDQHGVTHLPRIVTATHPEAGYAAALAVARWRFDRPKKNGNAVATRLKAPVKFMLKKPAEVSPGSGAAK